MSAILDIVRGAVARPSNEHLEDILAEMQKFGEPIVGIYGQNEWHCSIAMHNSAVGASFKVASGFKHKTAMEAAIECRDRMHAALAQLTGGRK